MNFGYRLPPTFNDTVWYFGCSITYGEYVEDQQTAPFHLACRTGLPIDNLGICGGSPDLVYFQIQKLINKHNPKCIIIQWPDVLRTFKIVNDQIVKLGVWELRLGSYAQQTHPEILSGYQKNLLNGKVEERNNYCIANVRNLVSCPLIEFTYESLLNGPDLDLASDGKHPGPITHSKIAELLVPRLRFELRANSF